MEVRLLQSQKARSPILVTLLGIVIEVRPLQPEKTKLGNSLLFLRVLISQSDSAVSDSSSKYIPPATIVAHDKSNTFKIPKASLSYK